MSSLVVLASPDRRDRRSQFHNNCRGPHFHPVRIFATSVSSCTPCGAPGGKLEASNAKDARLYRPIVWAEGLQILCGRKKTVGGWQRIHP